MNKGQMKNRLLRNHKLMDGLVNGNVSNEGTPLKHSPKAFTERGFMGSGVHLSNCPFVRLSICPTIHTTVMRTVPIQTVPTRFSYPLHISKHTHD